MKKAKIKNTEPAAAEFCYIDISPAEIIVDEGWNSRRQFDADQLFALGESLKATGQAQLIVVNSVMVPPGKPEYHLISGERRLRAARDAGLEKIGCKVYHDADVRQMTDLRFVENFHRKDLTHIEQANDMARMEEVGFSIADIAGRAGVSEDTVRRKISLLELPDEVRKMVDRPQNPLPIHQAQLLVGLPDSDCLRLARDAAPIVGQVASEQQVREWVDLIKNGPRMPFRVDEDGKFPHKKSARVTGGQVQSNIRHDPDKDDGANDVIGDPSDNIVIELATVQKTKDNGDFTDPYIYTLPIPKSLKKCSASVSYATDGKKWYVGQALFTPAGSRIIRVNGSPEAISFESSVEAVLAGMETLQNDADWIADNATVKNQKQNLQAIIEIIGKEMDAIRAKYLVVGVDVAAAEGSDMEAVAGNLGVVGKIGISLSGALVIQNAMVSVRLKNADCDKIHSCKLAELPIDLPAKQIAAIVKLIQECQSKPETETETETEKA